jgi:hypothetical protein
LSILNFTKKSNLFLFLAKNKIQFPRTNGINSYNIRRYVYEKIIASSNWNLSIDWNSLFNVGGQDERRCGSYIRVRKLWVFNGLQQWNDRNGRTGCCQKAWILTQLSYEFGFCSPSPISWRLRPRKSRNRKSDTNSKPDIVSYANHILVLERIYNWMHSFSNIYRTRLFNLDSEQKTFNRRLNSFELYHG